MIDGAGTYFAVACIGAIVFYFVCWYWFFVKHDFTFDLDYGIFVSNCDFIDCE